MPTKRAKEMVAFILSTSLQFHLHLASNFATAAGRVKDSWPAPTATDQDVR